VWGVIGRSIAFCLVNAGLTMVVGVALAVLMTRVGRFARTVLQVCLLLAWGTPVLATMTVWQWLFDSQYGVVDWLLAGPLGLSGMAHHSWIIEPLSFYALATLIVVWMSVPFVVFSVYAGLLQVPDEVEEAAELDGASAWQRLRHIALPMVRPVLMVVGLLQVIWDLRVFTQIYNLQRAGGVTEQTNLLGTYIYRQGVGGGHFGLASAAAMFMLALAVVMTAPYVRMVLKQEREAA
jgi:N,N'-diacetylchitobiose transport system permease protein